MVTGDQLVGLAAASVLLIVAPGPSVLFAIGRALSHGRRVALAGVVGNAAGCAVAAAVVAVGLGALLQRMTGILLILKLAGAAYLAWLGIHALRTAGRAAEPAPAAGGTIGVWRALRTGAVVGITNPKSFIVLAAILPQFVDSARHGIPLQMLLLAVVPIGIGLLTDSVWAIAAGQARQWLSRPRAKRVVARLGGLALLGLSISMAASPTAP